jgi:GNAT superfamily N-acetyltransferase
LFFGSHLKLEVPSSSAGRPSASQLPARIRRARYLELVDLFVDPDWTRRGVGRALLADAVGYAKTIGLGRIEVTGNPHAYAFYAAVGFVRDEDVVTDFGPAARLHLDVER